MMTLDAPLRFYLDHKLVGQSWFTFVLDRAFFWACWLASRLRVAIWKGWGW